MPTSGEDLEVELRPLFAELDSIEAETAAIASKGSTEASGRIADATREAVAIVEEAHARAAGERVRAAAAHHGESDGDSELDPAASRTQAEQTRALAQEGISELVDEVIECVKRTEY